VGYTPWEVCEIRNEKNRPLKSALGDHVGQTEVAGITTVKSNLPSRISLRPKESISVVVEPINLPTRNPTKKIEALNSVATAAPSRSANPEALSSQAQQSLKSVGLVARVSCYIDI